jgi:predicted PurR-regulated permease PerM
VNYSGINGLPDEQSTLPIAFRHPGHADCDVARMRIPEPGSFPPAKGMSAGRFAGRVLIALGIAAAFFLLWKLADVLILLFGGVLLATALSTGAQWLDAHTPLTRRWALLLVAVAVAAGVAGVATLIGGRLAGQLGDLYGVVPEALEKLRAWLERYMGEVTLLDAVTNFDVQATAARFTSFAAVTVTALANMLLVLFLGVYLALDPGLYVRGVLELVPREKRPAVAEALGAAGHALHRWLLGQLVAMGIVAAATFAGLWLLDVPYALSLAFVAGVLEFVPFLGPILAAVPAIVVAFTIGPDSAMAVALLYLGIQQVEGNLLMPLIQRWAVALPPALGILAVVVFGLLFGTLGVLFATPLMVVVVVLMRKLYVERALGEARTADPLASDAG